MEVFGKRRTQKKSISIDMERSTILLYKKNPFDLFQGIAIETTLLLTSVWAEEYRTQIQRAANFPMRTSKIQCMFF